MKFSDAEIEAEVVALEKVLDASEFDDAKNVSHATLRLLAIRNLENRVANKVTTTSEGPSGLIGAELLGMTVEQIFDPAPPATEWSGAKKVDFAGMTEIAEINGKKVERPSTWE
jgi:hypothetical protein